jgi:hypothetical protein
LINPIRISALIAAHELGFQLLGGCRVPALAEDLEG